MIKEGQNLGLYEEETMKYIFINPVVANMYVKEELDNVLIENGYVRVEVETDWHKIVKEKYVNALKQTSLTILDRRCPKIKEVIGSYLNHEQMIEPPIEPILIHCAIEIANREDLKNQKKIITTPCKSLADHGNKLNLEDTEFVSWKEFLKCLKGNQKLQGRCLAKSPIPPGYFTELDAKVGSVSGKENIEAYFRDGLYKEDQLVEMLYCHQGCNNGDGVLIDEQE